MLIRSRREFLRDTLRSVAAVGAVGAMSRFGEMNALAAGSNGYNALVCIFLEGGNDGHNTIIPIQTSLQGIAAYQKARGVPGPSSVALAPGSLLPIHNGSDVYGLHPMLPEIQSLYNAGNAAVLANVGMLVKPTTRSQYINNNNSALIPNALFSHSDQQNQWQSSIPTGLGNSGWGGRLADLVQPLNAGAVFPTMATLNGSNLFSVGQQNFAASVPPGGSAILNGMNNPVRANGLQQLLTFSNGMQLVQSANSSLSRGAAYANTLSSLLANAKLNTQFPMTLADNTPNPLAAQLQTVARMISVRSQLGLSRQIFFCELGGFDTHGDQLNVQNALLPMLSQAVAAFYAATVELGVASQVTTFTASEFGRTLMPSNSGVIGTDHAWGNHHFILGGAVKGGQFFGQYPDLSLGGPNDANTRGTLLPTTSVDQYGATLANWFGVSAANMPQVFPNIGNFQQTNLGILG